MRKLPLLLVLLASSLLAAAPPKPKLVLALVFDQFRYDYLTRFEHEYTGGFNTLLTRGAVFADARLIHFPTVTAVGHSTFLTGATPSISGIVGNDWYDEDQHAHVTSVSDAGTSLLGGGGGAGSSPRRLLVDTIGDELKMADGGKSRVIGISLKDRAAILPAGHTADGAYWFDPRTGNFVSSTYYFADLPAWVKDFNATRPADQYKGKVWVGHTMPAGGPELYSRIEASPFGNDLLERFAERALESEKLGTHDVTDVLAISFSAHDYVGHAYGPFAPEEHETSLQADAMLKRLLEFAERQAGAGNVLVVVTADHGVAPAPPRAGESKMPGGRIPADAVRNAVQTALAAKYGDGNWVAGAWDLSLYLNRDLAGQKKLDLGEVRQAAARAALSVAHVARVYTYDELHDGRLSTDPLSRLLINGFNAHRGPDLELVPDPYWIVGPVVTTHGSPYGYDTHIPIVFLGAGIRPGRYYERAAANDIAPTLAAILKVETPAGAVGRVLREMFLP